MSQRRKGKMSPEDKACAVSQLERRRERLTVSLYSDIRYLGGGEGRKEGEGREKKGDRRRSGKNGEAGTKRVGG